MNVEPSFAAVGSPGTFAPESTVYSASPARVPPFASNFTVFEFAFHWAVYVTEAYLPDGVLSQPVNVQPVRTGVSAAAVLSASEYSVPSGPVNTSDESPFWL